MRTKDEILRLFSEHSTVINIEIHQAWIKIVGTFLFFFLEVILDFRDIYRSK